jgi:hypothetical protein
MKGRLGDVALRASMLLFDEFGSLAGGRALAINIVERARSSGAGVLLSAQSAAGLGSESERERLIAASAAVIAFRSPMPAELAALAGSERTPEGAWSLSADRPEAYERVTVTEEQRPKAGPEDVDGGGQADLAVGQAEPALRLGQVAGDRADNGDLEPVKDPDGAEADDDQPVPARPRQPVQAPGDPRLEGARLDVAHRSTSRPLCLPCSVTTAAAEQTTAPVGWDG